MNPNDFVFDNLRDMSGIEDTDDFKEFLASVQAVGVLAPVTYWKNDKGENVIDDGGRRVLAARIAGIADIPNSRIPKPTEAERIERQVIINTIRTNFNPITIARGIKILQDEHGKTGEEIAAKFGRSTAWVSQIVGLLTLAEPLQAAVDEGKLGFRAAYAATQIPLDDQKEFHEQIVAAKTVRGVKETALSLQKIRELDQPTESNEPPPEISTEPEPDEEIHRIMHLLKMARDFCHQAIQIAKDLGVDIKEEIAEFVKEISDA